MYILLAVCAFGLLYIFFKRRSHAPPGPWGIPFLGNLHQFDFTRPHIAMADLVEKYGSIYRVSFWGQDVVVVSSASHLHEVLIERGKDFAGRPISYVSNQLCNDMIVNSDWSSGLKARRKFLHGTVRQYGQGLKKISRLTSHSCDLLIDSLRKSDGCKVEIQPLVNDFVHRILNTFILGTFHDDKEERNHIKDVIVRSTAAITIGGQGMFLDLFPLLRHFNLPILKELAWANAQTTLLSQKWRKVVTDENILENDGLLAKYLLLSEAERREHGLSDDLINSELWQVLGAGTITTFNSLCAMVNILVHHPQIQKKLQSEAHDRPVAMDDKAELPYHHAFILESSRYLSIVPTLVPHKAVLTSAVGGYVIPKGTIIWPNVWSLHHDDSIFPDPFVFKPERFLDDEGRVVPPDHPSRVHLLPFGAGPRVCMGQNFAETRIFLFIARIMQEFTLLPETTCQEQVTCDPRNFQSGATLLVPPYKIRVVQNSFGHE